MLQKQNFIEPLDRLEAMLRQGLQGVEHAPVIAKALQIAMRVVLKPEEVTEVLTSRHLLKSLLNQNE